MGYRCRVTIRGRIYPSIKAAAAALGYSERQAQRHLDRFGHLDGLGTPQTWRRPDRWRGVRIGGTTYDSVTAAAAALGLDRKTIRNAEAGHRAAQETVLRAAMATTIS